MIYLAIHKIIAGEPKYRQNQIFRYLLQEHISDWQEATTLPMTLRHQLSIDFPLTIAAQLIKAKNQAVSKAKIQLADGHSIETVLLMHTDGRVTVCVSTQCGCPAGCVFCATGRMGFVRNLQAEEIILQLLFWSRQIKKDGQRITNVVFMGMGDPFLNIEQVYQALSIFNDPQYFNIAARKISLSTVGIIAGIKKMASDPRQFNLAISLHAPNDRIRNKLIPMNKKYNISKILSAVQDYIKRTNRQVMFEYLLIDGINDDEYCAQQLAQLMDNNLYVVNLIPYNDTDLFRASSKKNIMAFRHTLEKQGIKVTQRYSFGADIDSACGQLVGN
ncbi:MAG: 23S rRNA (adenine(2503)-C(2))-methyltransferase RlmN [Candidatus Komeilibacteria bacterium CG_4_10_14_0_2_um_filter_37_10]|uniref:23S rRNA (Adenine(2503)-C(2))-methyltransferase RlmN n=1 Tax=Candidatus Komeilibacteria bacterium CG_4_10_14_0_2_um_filter_37_10 TaxID=1974470 RepID=A0A2M7VE35_9BACT|nr:MAG: 23S rRNA (adenine(2503)-C(2))-methyltransferase RlmN [Candidatus Komeilibacteria bacterium CG_4_10_14_0_2_um_filter_37_10]PJA94268.1 MAG: 23S rRNA (adenine(2503)-C(2))-methyltransferase RlmN [Candidatus Komeilibacteria bacterium CG_4_9_14_3_um_filter_37_5]